MKQAKYHVYLGMVSEVQGLDEGIYQQRLERVLNLGRKFVILLFYLK